MTTPAKIISLMPNMPSLTYYDAAFRRVLEDYLPTLIETSATQDVDSFMSYKYEGVFFDFLQHMKIPHSQHWIIMRVNDMTSPTQFDGRMKTMKMPDFATVEEIHANYRTQYRIRS